MARKMLSLRTVLLLVLGLLAISMLATADAGSAPPNNDKAHAIVISDIPFTQQFSNAGADVEAGEITPCGMGTTVWFRFTAPSSGKIAINLNGSNFDTGVAVYDLAGTLIKCNDDYYSVQSHLSFDAFTGTTYYIQVGGYNNRTGDVSMAMDLSSHFPSVSGLVRKEGSGDPLPSACVQIYDANHGRFGYTTTDAFRSLRSRRAGPGRLQTIRLRLQHPDVRCGVLRKRPHHG